MSWLLTGVKSFLARSQRRFSGYYEKCGPPAVQAAWRSHPPLFRAHVCIVFVLVALWNVSVTTSVFTSLIQGDNAFCETLREIRDLNLHIQMRLYQMLTRAKPDRFVSQDVTLVIIDNETHWNLLGGATPTNRSFLADLIRILRSTRPQVIALDVELLSPYGRRPAGSDDTNRADENDDLRKAIRESTEAHIPVILGGAFIHRGGHNERLLEIFKNQDLQPNGWNCSEQRCSGFGFVNTPPDRRLIPTFVQVDQPAGKANMDSFALAVAKARYGPLHPLPGINELTEDHTFGSFLREKYFNTVLAKDVWSGDAHKLAPLANQIVIIGGRWQELAGYGSPTDSHLSAAGMMSGMGLQANYVESLLYPEEHSREVPLSLGIVADLLLGLVIYAIFSVLNGPSRICVLVVAATFPIAAAYISFINFNRFLDFLFPLELYALHIAYELVEEHFGNKEKHAGKARRNPVAENSAPLEVGK